MTGFVLGDEFNLERVFRECLRLCVNMVVLLRRRYSQKVCQTSGVQDIDPVPTD